MVIVWGTLCVLAIFDFAIRLGLHDTSLAFAVSAVVLSVTGLCFVWSLLYDR